jgi:hypothetical protein
MWLWSATAVAQVPDTIFTKHEKIIGIVKENDKDILVQNSIDQSMHRIPRSVLLRIHYGNGTIENLKKSITPSRWTAVEISAFESETVNHKKLEIVSTKATGTTLLSSVTRIQYRAMNKLKMAAHLAGGDLVYLLHNATEGNLSLLRRARAQLNGIVFSSHLPDINAYNALVSQGKNFRVKHELRLANNNGKIKISNRKKVPLLRLPEARLINELPYIETTIKGIAATKFRMVAASDTEVKLFYKKGTSLRNLVLTPAD